MNYWPHEDELLKLFEQGLDNQPRVMIMLPQQGGHMKKYQILQETVIPEGYQFELHSVDPDSGMYKIKLLPKEGSEGFEVEKEVFGLWQVEKACKSLVDDLRKKYIDAELAKGPMLITAARFKR